MLPAQCPSGLLRNTVQGSIDSPRVVCASQVSRDIAPRFRRTRLRAARLSQWATLIRRTAEWAGGLGVWGAGGPWVTRVGGRLGWTADKRRPGLPGLLVCALPAQCR